MQVSLNPGSFAVAGPSSVPSQLLREAAGIRMLQKCLPLFAYIANQHRDTPHGPIAQMFLDREADRYSALTWSPIFRSWYSDVSTIDGWETLDPRHEALLGEFRSLILRPDKPQDYLVETPISLSPGGRYAPPELDWCWIADDPGMETMMPASLSQAAEAAASVEQGQSLSVKTDEGAGTIYKSVGLDGETWITNAHPRLKVYLSGTNQRDTGVLRGQVDWESYPDLWEIESYLAPYRLMAAVWPEEYADQLEILKAVVPMNIPKHYEGRSKALSFTLSGYQGAIFLTKSDAPRMLEMLLHEKAHVKQRYVEEVWPLLEREQTEQRFEVPWRPDPRPIEGIFEGINVFLQVVIGLSRCHLAGYYDLKRRTLDLLDHIQAGLDIIGRHARMTENGRAYYEGISGAFSEARTEFMQHEPNRQYSSTSLQVGI
jgi:hypothetical protein